MKNKTFKTKLFKSYIVIAILPLLCMTLFSYWNISKLINEKINNSINQNIEIIAQLIDSSINNLKGITQIISQNDTVNNILKKEKYNTYDEYFNDFQSIYTVISNNSLNTRLEIPIYIMGLNNPYSRFTNQEVYSTIYQNSNNKIFEKINSSENKSIYYIHRRVSGRESKDVVLTLITKNQNLKTGKILGYVFLDVYDDYFNDIFNNAKLYEGSNVYILDNKGNIITDKLYKNRTGFKFNEKYLDTILNNKSGRFECTLKDSKYMAYYSTLKYTNFKIVGTIPMKVLNKDKIKLIGFFIILLVLIGFLAIIISLILSRNISKPVNKLSSLMHKVEKGKLDVNFDIDCDDEIGQLGKNFNKMVKKIDELINEVYIKKYLLKEAELKALKNQINPHFLYNTLESINCMAKLGDNKGVSIMVTSLGKMLRYSMNKNNDVVTIREVVQQIKNYLSIQKVRFGDRFEIIIDVDKNIIDKKILKLIIQPIVENSIIHGLEPKIGKGTLNVKGYQINDIIIFEVIDDGIGIGSSQIKGNNIGMNNVDKRIKLQYGEKYGVKIVSMKNPTCVTITIPLL